MTEDVETLVVMYRVRLPGPATSSLAETKVAFAPLKSTSTSPATWTIDLTGRYTHVIISAPRSTVAFCDA